MEHRAKLFAESRHAGQTYGKTLPFIHHPTMVVATLKRFGITDQWILAAGWLHDILEDTPTTRSELVSYFGGEVDKLVWAVTDEQGKNRKERKTKAYAKIVEVGPRALIVKLADRIANVEHSIINNDSKMVGMYLSEARAFYTGLGAGAYDTTFLSLVEVNAIREMWNWLEMLYNEGELVA